jgi:hypothetical protein
MEDHDWRKPMATTAAGEFSVISLAQDLKK